MSNAKLGLTTSKLGSLKLGFISAGTDESASNTLTISQSVSAGKILTRSISQPLTITQSIVDIDDTQSVSTTLTITQSVFIKQPKQTASQSLTISQTVNRPGIFAKSASNTLVPFQVVNFDNAKPRSVSQSLTISQDPEFTKTTGVSQALTVTQSVVYAYAPHSESPIQSLVLTQSLARPVTFGRADSESITLSQVALARKILTRSATSVVHFVSNAIGQKLSGITQTITIAQTVTPSVQRIRSNAQSLTLSHSVHVQLILNRSMSSSLVFTKEHQIPDGTGGFIIIPNLIYTKGGVGGGTCCPVPGRSVTIVGVFSTIVLSNPELGDAEAPVSAIKIIRTITGDVYTYVRKNRSRKLKYKFVLTRKKAYELRKFLLQNLTKRVTLSNWKGEIWNVNFLTDPVDLIADKHCEPPCGEWYTVALDFEGIRVN